MVDPDLHTQRRCPSPKTHGPDTKAVDITEQLPFKPGKLPDLTRIVQLPHQLHLGKPRNLVLRRADADADDIGRASPALRLLYRIKNTAPDTFKVTLCTYL